MQAHAACWPKHCKLSETVHTHIQTHLVLPGQAVLDPATPLLWCRRPLWRGSCLDASKLTSCPRRPAALLLLLPPVHAAAPQTQPQQQASAPARTRHLCRHQAARPAEAVPASPTQHCVMHWHTERPGAPGWLRMRDCMHVRCSALLTHTHTCAAVPPRCPAMKRFRPSLHSRRGRSAAVHAVTARTGEREAERAAAAAGAGTVAGRGLRPPAAAAPAALSTAPVPLRRMGFFAGAGACAGLRIRSSIRALSARLSSSARWACSAKECSVDLRLRRLHRAGPCCSLLLMLIDTYIFLLLCLQPLADFLVPPAARTDSSQPGPSTRATHGPVHVLFTFSDPHSP